MSRGVPAALLVAMPAIVALAGCESSQSRSAELAAAASTLAAPAAGSTVRTASREIDAEPTVITDANGTAVVVELRNRGSRDAFEVPVQITLRDEAGTELYTNTASGLQRSLTQAGRVDAGASVYWVNDQIPLTAAPAEHEVVAGDGAGKDPGVRFSAGTPRLDRDPASGLAAVGRVRHDAATEQQRVLVTVIARRGDEIVAAGRAIVPRVKPGRDAKYTAFFIGDPQGADLTASAALSHDTE